MRYMVMSHVTYGHQLHDTEEVRMHAHTVTRHAQTHTYTYIHIGTGGQIAISSMTLRRCA